jgi:uncharacterized membrane protein YhaH (DUF805 family)
MLGFVLDNISFRGRASRVDYWLVTLLGPIAVGIVVMASLFVLGRAGIVVAALMMLVFLLVVLGNQVRRLHDRDMSGHWIWLFSGLPGLLGGIGRVVHDPRAAMFCAVVSGLVMLWAYVELGFLPGSDGANRFGTR